MTRQRPTDEELVNLYLTQKLSIHQISKATGFSRRSVMRWIGKTGFITRRTSNEIKLRLRKHCLPDPPTLHRLYWTERLSLRKIGQKLGGSEPWVLGLMKMYGIPRRTLGEAGMEFPKTAFSGEPLERAYLIGFRVGDLHAGINGNQVRIGTSSTHPAMWELIDSSFRNYGRVNKTPARLRDDYEWSIYAYLDRSFEFLLRKPHHIPEEILSDSILFLSFLSGYLDAEGNLRIYRDGESCSLSIRVNSEDEGILREIKKALSNMGYHVYFALGRRRGLNKGKRYRRDVWSLGLFRKAEIIDLLNKLSFRHAEKIEWARLMISSINAKWISMKPLLMTHRESIRKGVYEFKNEARRQFSLRHTATTRN